jgi:hypothetical protein
MQAVVERIRSKDPTPTRSAELDWADLRSVRRIGRLRVPLTLHHAPWATLYRHPDGRTLWVLRLWMTDRAVRRVVSTRDLLAYATTNRLERLRAEVERLLARAEWPHDG